MHARGELRKDADPEKPALGLPTAPQGALLLTQIRRRQPTNNNPLPAFPLVEGYLA